MRTVGKIWEGFERWIGRIHVLDWMFELFGWRQIVIAFITSFGTSAWAFIRKTPGPVSVVYGLLVFAAILVIIHYGILIYDKLRGKITHTEKHKTNTMNASQGQKNIAACHIAIGPSTTNDAQYFSRERLHTLYEVFSSSIKLKFIPDSRNPLPECILLLLYGYKEFLGAEEVSVSTITWGIPMDEWHRWDLIRDPHQYSVAVIAKEHLHGYVERVGLSRGGYLRLTAKGCERAKTLARDLISRA